MTVLVRDDDDDDRGAGFDGLGTVVGAARLIPASAHLRFVGTNICGCGRAAGLRVEAVAGEQRVRPAATAARVRLPGEGALVTGEKPLGCRQVDTAIGCSIAHVATLVEELVDDGPIDALQRQLAAQGDLTAGPRPIPGLDPGPGEGRVVEHPELGQPLDRSRDEIRPVAGLAQPTADLDDRSWPDLEEARGRLENDRRIIDRGAPLATLGR